MGQMKVDAITIASDNINLHFKNEKNLSFGTNLVA